MKNTFFLILFMGLFILPAFSQEEAHDRQRHIVISTSKGDIEILLYDDTPLHRDNMIKLVNDDFYDNLIFHRVIKNFMIQGGDPHSAGASRGMRLGTGGPGYRIPAEFVDSHFHKKGVIAAARLGDNENPEKMSSGSQFYIVQGQIFSEDMLRVMESNGYHSAFSAEQIKAYTTVGGTPHLDGSYTVFGEVVGGLDVVDSIASMKTDAYDRPVEDVVFSIRLK